MPSPWRSAFSTRLPSACSRRSGSPREPRVGRAIDRRPRAHVVRRQASQVALRRAPGARGRRSARAGQAAGDDRRARGAGGRLRGARGGRPPPRRSEEPRSSSASERGRRSASSSSVVSSASGVRSSWLASATNARSRSSAVSSRSSIAFSVSPRRCTSSRACGHGQAPARLGRGDRLRLPAHRLDRPERGGREGVPEQRRRARARAAR